MQSLDRNEDFSAVVSCQGIRELIYKSNVLSDLMPEIGTRCIKGKCKSPPKEWGNELYFCHSNAFTNKYMYFLPYSKHCQAKKGPTWTPHVELFWESCSVLLALMSLGLQCYYTAGQSFLLCSDLTWHQKEDLLERIVISSDRTHPAWYMPTADCAVVSKRQNKSL